MVRLMLLVSPLLIGAVGCRAEDDRRGGGSDAARAETLAAETERLVRAACDANVPGAPVQPRQAIRHFGRDNLHRYMNGAAERYLGYSFDHAAVGEVRAGDERFTVEVYHFARSADAYGLWSTDAAGEDVEVGQQSAYGGGLLQFRRGPYFARVFHARYRDSTRETVLTMGRSIAQAIREEGDTPELLNELPPSIDRSMVKGAPVFFHEQAMLNHVYYLSDENLLRLGPDTDALFVEYANGEEQAKVLLVRYSEDIAGVGRRAFCKGYLEAEPVAGIQVMKLENGHFTGISQPDDRTLWLVFDASTEALATKLLTPAKP